MIFFKRWTRGFLRVRISGFFSERFLNLCSANQIELWELKPEKDGVICCITLPAFYKIRPLARKANVRIRVVDRLGFPFFLRRNKKRVGLALGMCSFFLILYLLSLFVWNISFEGNNRYTRDTLLKYLEEEGICYGMRKEKISCEKLEEGIRSRFPEITWVSARVSGTRLLIKIKENEVLFSVPQKDEAPCDLVAKRAGIVTKMIVRRGKAAVMIGSQVEEGQLLVSSKLSVMNDNGEIVRTDYVHADADIYAQTEYGYQTEIPKLHAISVNTGRKRLGAGIRIGPYQLRFVMPLRGENPWRFVSESSQLCFFQDFYLPVYFEQIKGEEYIVYERLYTEEEIQTVSEQLQEQYLKNLMEKGVQIIENNVKISENGSFYIIEGRVAAQEMIAAQSPVADMGQIPLENEETTDRR